MVSRKLANNKTRLKYKALQPYCNDTKKREYLDYDYLKKLTEEELKFLNKFTDEYYGGYFTKNKETGRYKGNIHTSSEQRKECYKRNNKRQNCIISTHRAKNTLYPLDLNVIDTPIDLITEVESVLDASFTVLKKAIFIMNSMYKIWKNRYLKILRNNP